MLRARTGRPRTEPETRAIAFAAVVALAGCSGTSVSGFDCSRAACDDGDSCNGAESCDPERGCIAGTPMSCSDLDPCTDDRCDPSGCVHVARDLDGDGHADPCAGGDDCAPGDASRFPGAPEVCNGADDDCDLAADEGLDLVLLSEFGEYIVRLYRLDREGNEIWRATASRAPDASFVPGQIVPYGGGALVVPSSLLTTRMGGWVVDSGGETVEPPRSWSSFSPAYVVSSAIAGNGRDAIKVFADRQVTVAPIGCAGASSSL